MNEICIQASNLKKYFSRRQGNLDFEIKALDDVSLTLKEGASLAITGPSGCGKTTLLKIFTGSLRPDSGSCSIQRPIGFVAQDPYASLSSRMQVNKIIAEPLIFTRQERSWQYCIDRVKAAMKEVCLDYDVYAERFPGELSGGERQRVCIARALILQPRILIMDEPTSMLDKAVKSEIGYIIKNISQKNRCCFLMVTHDISFAAEVCRDIVIMQNGKIVESGLARQVFSNPQAKLTRDLINIATDVRLYWKERYGITY